MCDWLDLPDILNEWMSRKWLKNGKSYNIYVHYKVPQIPQYRNQLWYFVDPCMMPLVTWVPVYTQKYMQSHMCMSTHMQFPQHMLASLSTMQLHMPNRNFIITTATLVTVIFCFLALLFSFSSQIRHFKYFNNKKLSISYTQVLDYMCNSKQ